MRPGKPVDSEIKLPPSVKTDPRASLAQEHLIILSSLGVTCATVLLGHDTGVAKTYSKSSAIDQTNEFPTFFLLTVPCLTNFLRR